MTDALLVLRKLALLREHLDRVRRRRPATAGEFVADIDVQDALALSLLVAVQEAADLALHVAADEGWGIADSYADAFAILARHGVIEDDHARQLSGIAALRNRIAHGYASVDPARLWNELPDGIDALDRYAIAIARFVDQGA